MTDLIKKFLELKRFNNPLKKKLEKLSKDQIMEIVDYEN